MRVMDCVLILFRRQLNPVVIDTEKKCVTPSWNESLKVMSQGGFLQALVTFGKVRNIISSSGVGRNLPTKF